MNVIQTFDKALLPASVKRGSWKVFAREFFVRQFYAGDFFAAQKRRMNRFVDFSSEEFFVHRQYKKQNREKLCGIRLNGEDKLDSLLS
jgi:hypothetical protein